MANYRLCCLGRPYLEMDGEPVKLEMRKTLALLAYLSLCPQSPTRETLAALFWPEYDQQHAMANLRRNLSSLAKSLPPGLLETDRERIGIERKDWLKVDVEEFRGHLTGAGKHPPPDGSFPDFTSALENAISIYKGDFFEGFNLKDCPEFDQWQFFQREILRTEYGGALQKLAEYYQNQCEWEKALMHGRSLLALDRLHEPAHRILMRLYFLSGQKSAAIQQFEECKQILDKELGQPPESETLKLYEEIRKGTPPQARRAQQPPKTETPASAIDSPLTKTKFFLPKAPRTILHRPRLVTLLNHSVKMPLTLLSASAGFGKTTLLAEWAAQSKDRIAWISLDRNDNDVYRMVDYIVNAIRNILPGSKVGAVALSLLHAPQPVQIPVIVGSLINDLISISDPLILVLDDYHNIEAQAAHEAINFLLDHRPENLHLVISTRADPPLSLARLRANIQLSDIRTDDLRFTHDETRSFLTQVIGIPLSAQDMGFFEDRIEGWITGIQMAALAMQSGSLSQSSAELHNFIRAFKGSQRYILDYLVEEVLSRQTEAIREFLFRTSILEKMCYELCDHLLARDDVNENQPMDKPGLATGKPSQQTLEFLERSNLFLVPLDDERKWYRYHHLFADLLHARLRQYEPKMEAVLHKRAASWYIQNSYPIEAVKHALVSGDYSFAADFIEECSLKLIWMNQIVTTLDWFKSLPADVVESRPLLTIYQTFMLARRGEFERVEAILSNAEAAMQTMPASRKVDDYRILIFGMRAFIANLKGESEKAIQFSLAISPVAGKPQNTSYYMARAQLAVAYLDTGDMSSAEGVFTEILHWAQESQDVYYALLTNKELAELWCLRGRLSQAEQLYKQMVAWIGQTVQAPAPYTGLVKVYEANLLIEKNELETARLLLLEDIESLLSAWRSSSLYMGYVALANLHTALGDFQRAKAAVEKAYQWVTSQSLYLRNKTTVHACQVNLWLAEGNLAEAQRWAQGHFPEIPADLPFVRELDHLCLARILVASHRWEEALDLLQRLSVDAEARKRFGRLLKIDILRSLTLDGLGRSEEALDVLDGCLQLAQPEGYVRVFLDEGAPMKNLLQRRIKERDRQAPRLLDYDPKNPDYAVKLQEAFSLEHSLTSSGVETALYIF